MEKLIGLLCANVFLLKTTLAYTVVFNFTLTFTLGENNLLHNVTLSIKKKPVKEPFLNNVNLAIKKLTVKIGLR